MMFTIFSIAFAMGALLALRFKFLILLPAIGLAAICAVGAGIAYGDSIGAVMLTTALVTAGLQIGYVFALFAPNDFNARQFGGVHSRGQKISKVCVRLWK